MIRTRRKKRKQKNDSGSIIERNRIALAFIELGGDKVFKKLAEDHKLRLVREVLSIGDEVATWLASEYGANDPRKIAAAMGIKVFGEDQGKAKGSEYRQKKMEIVVYRNFHEKLVREVQNQELSENLLKFLVAHELFRHLEINRIGEIYKRYKFKTWSNVAAQAFTQTLLRLEISPQVFDYLTYILYTNS